MVKFLTSLLVLFFIVSCGGNSDLSDNTSEVNSSIQVIDNIKWLKEEPDGYFGWEEANIWCTDKGYRLPLLSELIRVWNANSGKTSPTGFEKDTFYWSSEGIIGSHSGCAMDANCSGSGNAPYSWNDDAIGHPKCVID